MQSSDANARAVEAACEILATGDARAAAESILAHYPHLPVRASKRGYSVHQVLDTFAGDGFIDRYTGAKLLFPGVLHVLSDRLPAALPRHANWKMSETHRAYWELMPTIDHVVPAARGGSNSRENWVTTSMLRNSAKANWTLDELGWTLHPKGDLRLWDGLMGWFEAYVAAHTDLLAHERIRRWEWACRHRRARLGALEPNATLDPVEGA